MHHTRLAWKMMDLESAHRPDPLECLPNRTSTISVGFYTKDHTDPLTNGRV
jgi:hypothetical protein